jgi:hypothetical protein
MSNRRSSSTRVRSLRPSLECLEERNLLSNSAFVNILGSFDQSIPTTEQQCDKLNAQVISDVDTFKASPNNVGSLITLVTDCAKLISLTDTLAAKVNFFATLVPYGEITGLLTGDALPANYPTNGGVMSINRPDNLYFNSESLDYQFNLFNYLDNAGEAYADIVAALLVFSTGGSASAAFPTPQSSPTQTNQTNGTVSESINTAPATASESGGVISQSVTVTNPSNTPVAVTETYSATDGTSTSMSDTCTNGSITVVGAAPPSAPGVVGTWTTTVTGLPTQTNTTTWTQ